MTYVLQAPVTAQAVAGVCHYVSMAKTETLIQGTRYHVRTTDNTAEAMGLVANGWEIVATTPKILGGTSSRTEYLLRYPVVVDER